jgi:signal transduction histidine kinase
VLPLISPDEAWVTGDRDLMTRAVINLVSNAIKYSPENTTVTIALTLQHAEHDNEQNKQWKIDVQDEGMGISPANLSRLFMRFQRLHQEGQPQTDGIGLGLVFVKTVIERMGGEVIVDSRVAATTDGQHGTTFTILLAATDPDA